MHLIDLAGNIILKLKSKSPVMLCAGGLVQTSIDMATDYNTS